MAELTSIKLEDVCLRTKQRLIIDNLSVTFSQHGISFIMGDNGAGKTQLLRLIHGLVKPESGKMILPARFAQAFLFQSPVLLRRSVEENLRYIRGSRVCSANQFDSAYHDVVSLFSLSDILTQAAISLSGGQKKRVACARLFLQHADYYLLDEPSANIDRQNNLLIEKSILQLLDSGKKVLFVTHDYPQLVRLFKEGRDEIICLKSGKCINKLTKLDLDTLHSNF